ncbi:uncharacterized protein LOC122253541 [Penaeus japonicus]|uniref:uncharacterized protein LOC122253541 n=1 Tax=Penaeus japonicus TaxID=27405 RepID=UPI001C7108A4|nr:uncharacterized protein LOC122253541 [Penaeus japonicus]
MMIWTTQSHKMSPETKSWAMRKTALVVLVVFLTLSAIFGYLFLSEPAGERYNMVPFEDRLKEICASPKLPMPEYRGVQSFYDFLTNPDTDYCYSWIEFGGEKIPIPSQSDKECADEVRKSKYICFNEEYKMTHDPCLIYSFDQDADTQFEQDMNMFSCEVHSFDSAKVTESEHVHRSEFWKEHAWTIGELPYDKPLDDGKVQRRRSIDFIAKALDHKGKEIKYIKSDLEGREWILLRQIITHSDLMDIRQVGLRLHTPLSVNQMTGEARHEYFSKLFKVFQGMSCAGYKYILGRPIKYYKGTIRVPEMSNSTYFPAYEVNWAKVIN